ncbi:MAG: aldehyde dehydrogenase family protein [Phototrophicaceae bacterium]
MTLTVSRPQTDFPPTSPAEMDAKLAILNANKRKWVQTAPYERIAIIEEVLAQFRLDAPQWVAASVRHKGRNGQSAAEGEEYTYLTSTIRHLQQLKHILTEIAKDGRPHQPTQFTPRPDNRVSAKVFPLTQRDALTYSGMVGEVWFEPNITPEQIREDQAHAYHNPDFDGAVTLVLGAGNLSLLVPGDFLYKLFNENRVVILKMNPVNQYLGPLVEQTFAAFITRGFLQVVYGGVAEGTYLIEHPAVQDLHMTGADRTHDAIVFGTGDEAIQRKAARQPKINKPFSSELGNITPVIVVPGAWSQDDIAYQANHFVSHFTANAGFNCITPRLLVMEKSWPLREAFLQAIQDQLATVPPRMAYYPNAQARYDAFLTAHPDAITLGNPQADQLAWAIIANLDAASPDEIAFRTEAFCSIATEVPLEAASPADFIQRAVEFVNMRVWGTLGATLIVHPNSANDPQISAALEQGIADLRYGMIGVNVYTSINYGLLTTVWGGHSGQDISDIQSGIGFINNLLMLEHAQKTVIRLPFRHTLSSVDLNSVGFGRLTEALFWSELEPNRPIRWWNLVRAVAQMQS